MCCSGCSSRVSLSTTCRERPGCVSPCLGCGWCSQVPATAHRKSTCLWVGPTYRSITIDCKFLLCALVNFNMFSNFEGLGQVLKSVLDVCIDWISQVFLSVLYYSELVQDSQLLGLWAGDRADATGTSISNTDNPNSILLQASHWERFLCMAGQRIQTLDFAQVSTKLKSLLALYL